MYGFCVFYRFVLDWNAAVMSTSNVFDDVRKCDKSRRSKRIDGNDRSNRHAANDGNGNGNNDISDNDNDNEQQQSQQ